MRKSRNLILAGAAAAVGTCVCLAALVLSSRANRPDPTNTPMLVMTLPETHVALAGEVTRIVEVTREVVRTELVTVVVTELVTRVVTASPTPTPRLTLTASNTPGPPTETNTPAPTATPSPSPNAAQSQTAQAFAALTAERGNGIYLVNVDIAPGVWRNNGTGDSCYWKRSRRNGDIIDNHFGQSGGTIFIAATDFSVEFDDCGRWTYLGPP